jgi:hypothetical protein
LRRSIQWHSVAFMLGESNGAAWLQAVSALFQAIAVGVAGFWALYLYRTSRKGRASLGIEQKARVLPIGQEKQGGILLVRLRISNLSGVLFRHSLSVAYLLDASRLADDGRLVLLPFAAQDPLLPVFGKPAPLSEASEGRPFSYGAGGEVALEPGEAVETSLAFKLEDDRLLALLVKIEGYEQTSRWLTRPKRWDWSSFDYIDPTSSHASEAISQ